MFTPDAPSFQTLSRVPLTTIDAIVSARLGTTRVKGNGQSAVFNRLVAMYLAKHVGGWSTTAIGKFYNGRHHSQPYSEPFSVSTLCGHGTRKLRVYCSR